METTILIIDDDPAITDAVAAALEDEGRRVITCQDTESAELVIERVPVDLVISDVRFSGQFEFEGLEFLRFMARKAPHTPIVLMTGMATPELVEEAHRRGASAVLSKPFDLQMIESLLQTRAA